MSMSHKLNTLALRVGGFRSYEFSQSRMFKVAPEGHIQSSKGVFEHKGKLYKMVLRREKPMGGVCATLCAFWIIFHAKQGENNSFTRNRSVWEYMINEGEVNIGALQNITVEHHMSSGNQFDYLKRLMAKFEIDRRTRHLNGQQIVSPFMRMRHDTTFQCSNAIMKVGGYKLIQLKKTNDGSGGGHMVAAWSDYRDVLFMDPNFGEFWFPNGVSFKIWFSAFLIYTYLRKGYKSLKVNNFV